jgi:hypothetical protein
MLEIFPLIKLLVSDFTLYLKRISRLQERVFLEYVVS